MFTTLNSTNGILRINQITIIFAKPMEISAVQLLLFVITFYARVAVAAEPAKELIEKWTVCTQNSDCEIVHWGSCTILSVNSKYQEEILQSVDPHRDPLREMNVRDAECYNNLNETLFNIACQNKSCVLHSKSKVKAMQKLQAAPFRIDY